MAHPFLPPTVNTHTGFVPTKINVVSQSSMSSAGVAPEARVLKPPKAPEKPLMPYMRYSRKMWDSVRAQNPDAKLWDIGRIIGQMWRECPEYTKQEFCDEYDREKVEYEKALKAYHNSSAYQSFLQNKKASSEKPARQKTQVQPEIGVFIQPVEDDESVDPQFSAKHISAARFQRNHRLAAEICSPAAVPDSRTIVTSQRMNVLNKQVQSLTMHQKKLEGELVSLEEKFEAKKRQIEESGKQFLEKMKELCDQKPVIDEVKFQEMVARHEERIKKQYAEWVQRTGGPKAAQPAVAAAPAPVAPTAEQAMLKPKAEQATPAADGESRSTTTPPPSRSPDATPSPEHVAKMQEAGVATVAAAIAETPRSSAAAARGKRKVPLVAYDDDEEEDEGKAAKRPKTSETAKKTASPKGKARKRVAPVDDDEEEDDEFGSDDDEDDDDDDEDYLEDDDDDD